MTSYDDVLATIRRDINCLADPARFKRKKAMQTLGTFVEEQITEVKGGGDNAVLRRLFQEELSGPFLKMFGDDTEQNRIKSLAIYRDVAAVLGEEGVTPAMFVMCVQTIHQRVTSQVDTEPAEEVRLQLIQLMHALLLTQQASFYWGLVELVELLSKAVSDPFPELKREASEVIGVLADFLSQTEEIPVDKRVTHYDTLTKAMAPNLGHQHNKVRIHTVKALGALVAAKGGDISPAIVELFPVLSKLTQDRTPSVRKQLPVEMLLWLSSSQPSRSNHGRLMMLLLAGVADDNKEVHEAALQALDKVGEIAAAFTAATLAAKLAAQSAAAAAAEGSAKQDQEDQEEGSAKQDKEEEDNNKGPVMDENNDPAPTWQTEFAAPIKARPPFVARKMICSSMTNIFPSVITDLTDWTAGARVRSAGVLHALIMYSEHHASVYIKELLPALFRTARDVDNDLHVAVAKTCRAIGWLIPPDVHVTYVCALVLSNADANYRCSVLVVLTNLVMGIPKGALDAHWDDIVNMVADEEICSSSSKEVRFFAVKLLEVLMEKEPSLCNKKGTSLRLFQTLLICDGASESKEERQVAVMAMMSLASCQLPSQEGKEMDLTDIYGLHFVAALETITQGRLASEWSSDLVARASVFALLTRSVRFLPEHMDLALPLLVGCSDKEGDPKLRLHVMSVLYQVLFSDTVDPAYLTQEEALQLLKGVLVPQLIWRSGSVASAIRLQALVCLEGMLRRKLVTAAVLRDVESSLNPVLKGNVDDDEPDIRIAVVKIYGHVFAMQETVMDDMELTDLHREMLKRMDDSDDDIRIEVTRVFQIMMKTCFPPFEVYDLNDQHFAYIVKTFLIHLDDSNPLVQQAVQKLLRGIAYYALPTFKKQVMAVRGRHSDPTLVEELITMITQLESPSP